MESPNSLYSNNINNTSKDGFESDNVVIPSNFLISTKEIIARFPHNKRVGHYLLGRKLGEGSFAKVKEGLQTLTGQKVAIKVIDKKKAKEDAYVSKNMRREGKLLQMIIHPNIIQLYELMETENSYYLVTELCEGGDLMDYICARKYLSEACTRKFIRQIISAVDYLHRIGILHRDLKIENLLLDKNLNIKLIDFGLSNYTKSELCITQCGSPAYAAPELLAHKKYGCKVDVWSIGVNMYAMLTGNLPFTVEPFNIKSLYNKMMKNEMNAIPEHLSKSGEDLLRKLLNPDPVKRISLKEAMEHPWINEGYASQLKPFPYPNKPTEEQINPTILRYMNTNMEFSMGEVTENIKSNKPSSALATYYLLFNKVKTMLMKIEPKKTRTETKQLTVKDLKATTTTTTATKPVVNTVNQCNQVQILPSIQNAQSPLSRTTKQPVTANLTVTTTIANGYTVIRSTQTNPNKEINATLKHSERAQSPIPSSTSGATTLTSTTTSAGSPTNLNGNNPASAFAGAIKTLTQKYKTMHLTTPLDNSLHSNNHNNNTSNNPSNNNNNNASTTSPTNANNNTITTNSSGNSANTTNFHYKTAYINQHQPQQQLNSSLDQTFNNITIIGEQTITTANNNSESLSSSEDNTTTTNTTTTNTTNTTNNNNNMNTTAHTNKINKTNSNSNTFLNRNNTPPSLSNKLTNGGGGGAGGGTGGVLSTNAEWTQLIKLPFNNGNSGGNTNKLKSSDLNNNDLTKNNSNTVVNHHQHHQHPQHQQQQQTFNDNLISTTTTTPPLSTLHLNGSSSNSNNNTSSISPTSHMPVLTNNAPSATATTTSTTTNNNNTSTSSNNNSTTANNRTTKSPLVKKLSSPITLPSLDSSRSTSQ